MVFSLERSGATGGLDVELSRGVLVERFVTTGGVVVSLGVVNERLVASSGVGDANSVGSECLITRTAVLLLPVVRLKRAWYPSLGSIGLTRRYELE